MKSADHYNRSASKHLEQAIKAFEQEAIAHDNQGDPGAAKAARKDAAELLAAAVRIDNGDHRDAPENK